MTQDAPEQATHRAPRTGFYLLDGPDNAPWRPAPPRGVIAAGLIVWSLLFVELVATGLLYRLGIYFRPAEPTLIEGGIGMVLFYALIATISIGFILVWDRRPLRALGLSGAGWRQTVTWLALGFLLGAPMIVEAAVQTGNWEGVGYAAWAVLLGTPFFLFPAAVEEIVFRGWLMQTIAARHGGLVALWGAALIFATWHLDLSGSPVNALLSVLFRLPAGLMLGLIALRQRSLWPAIGAHTGWNAANHGAVAIVADDEGKSPWDDSYMVGQDTQAYDLVDPYFAFDVAHQCAVLALVFWLARAEYRQLLTDSAAWRWLRGRVR